MLVDAPCSGIGTLRRRPEIARNRDGTELAELAAQQIAITRRAATLCKPGGRLVYAVCSLEPEEGPALVRAACDAGAFTLVREDAWTPEVHHTDGFYLAVLRPR